jgi:hypothetical protein
VDEIFGPADRQADGPRRMPDIHKFLKRGLNMQKLVIAAAFALISASAHAGTYSVEGYTIHVSDGCSSSSCVSVYAPGYGYYHGGSSARLHKAHKDTSRFAAVTKKDDAKAAPGTAPAVDATPAATPEKAVEPAVQATPTDTPAK